MRRRAMLLVEYAKESGRPIEPEDWAKAIETVRHMQMVAVEVLEDEPA